MFLYERAPEFPFGLPTQTTLTLVTPAGAVHEYVPAVVYSACPGVTETDAVVFDTCIALPATLVAVTSQVIVEPISPLTNR